ncbi:M23 family metallopeptidase [Arthrobacter sp. NPDC058288]|uniref:M23 family metallopeptidase n=1 Tax=Arthrobacter sp. NPDC058288 TaxID=3346424 RepID=UPI0036EFA01C
MPAALTLSAAVLVAAALTGAHADTTVPGGDTTAAISTVTAGPAIQASAAAVLSFDRPPVTTEPADADTGAAARPATAPAGPAPQSRLSAPLASMAVSSPFGLRTSPITGGSAELHTGLDLAASCQTAVFSAGAGTVVEAGWSPYGGGNRIVVDHGNGLQSTYNHLSSIETAVGATVDSGQRLAGAGTTGNSTGCHLHFEVLFNGLTVNPQGWM